MAIISDNLTVHEVTCPKELHDIWPRIRDGLQSVINKCQGMIEMPEDTYHAIKTGESRLLVGTIEDCYAGFFIVSDISCVDGKGLLISIICNAGNDVNFVGNFFKVIEKMVFLGSYRRATFAITRKGWAPFLNRMGYKVSSITYQTIEA